MVAFDSLVSGIAAAIGEPARSRMLFALMDGRARTSTELSAVGDVGPSTASAHLAKLKEARLVHVLAQGRHRYYRLAGEDVGRALEGLAVLAGAAVGDFTPTAPARLRAARTCYDHAAGRIGVAVHDALLARRWLRVAAEAPVYEMTPGGGAELADLGINIAETRGKRRRFACACLDWSERRPHLGGALGAALLALFLKKGWLERDLDSRALSLTDRGRRGFAERLGAAV